MSKIDSRPPGESVVEYDRLGVSDELRGTGITYT